MQVHIHIFIYCIFGLHSDILFYFGAYCLCNILIYEVEFNNSRIRYVRTRLNIKYHSYKIKLLYELHSYKIKL